MRSFAMGAIYALPSGANPTAIPIAILKDATVGFKQNKKVLRGNMKGIIDVADGALDITIKIKNSDFRAANLALLTTGAVTSTGTQSLAVAETGTIPATPFQITVANGANFTEDAGVYDYTAGIWLTRVAAGPATKQFSVSTLGVYTFAVADVGHFVLLTYKYATATIGTTTTFNNVIQGASTGYLTRIFNMYSIAGVSRPLGFDFPNVHYDGLDVGLKVEDWSESNLSGIVAQDTASLQMYKAYTGE